MIPYTEIPPALREEYRAFMDRCRMALKVFGLSWVAVPPELAGLPWVSGEGMEVRREPFLMISLEGKP